MLLYNDDLQFLGYDGHILLLSVVIYIRGSSEDPPNMFGRGACQGHMNRGMPTQRLSTGRTQHLPCNGWSFFIRVEHT